MPVGPRADCFKCPFLDAQSSLIGAGKHCLELQDALQQLPPEIHLRMLPASRTMALRRTSKTMRTAVEKADAVVEAREGIQVPDGQGLVYKLHVLNAW